MDLNWFTALLTNAAGPIMSKENVSGDILRNYSTIH